MINGSTGLAVLSILFIVILLCRYSWCLGYKAGQREVDDV